MAAKIRVRVVAEGLGDFLIPVPTEFTLSQFRELVQQCVAPLPSSLPFPPRDAPLPACAGASRARQPSEAWERASA